MPVIQQPSSSGGLAAFAKCLKRAHTRLNAPGLPGSYPLALPQCAKIKSRMKSDNLPGYPMAEKRAKTPVKEMSQIKQDLLQQALHQVKVLKAKLESADHADAPKLQQALVQIESLKEQLNSAEASNRKHQQALHELKTDLESSKRAKTSRLEGVLQQVQALKQEVASLKDENSRLKRQLEIETSTTSDARPVPTQLTIDLPTPAPNSRPTDDEKGLVEQSASQRSTASITLSTLSPQQKLALFADLFPWRRDVYAARWESRSTGKNGYSPARQHHEFHGKNSCPVPPACPNLPPTDIVLKEHLQGKTTIGVYPILENEMCRFVAIDLDQKNKNRIVKCAKVNEPWSEHLPPPKREVEKQSEQLGDSDAIDSWSWKEDARALLNAAGNLDVPAYLERSRSGTGGHVWIFFEEPLSAALARRLAEALITKAERDTGQLSLRSYDRMFPNQDTIPQKGYGNLIALPLQKVPLSSGNSAFLDESMVPYDDQWAFLQSVKKMSTVVVEALVTKATRQNALMPVDRPSEKEEADEKIDPWALPPSAKRKEDTILTPPLPTHVAITLSNFVYIPKIGLTRSHLNRIERIAAFQNPQFYKNQNLRLSNYKTPRIISCAEEFPEHLALPRGCLADLIELLNKSGVAYSLDDKRFSGRKVRAKFKGKLRDDQKKAAQELLTSETGVLSAVPGFGKTVIAAYCIAKRKVNTLVLVHRQTLLRQWKERLSTFLELPPESIGQIGGGKNKPTGIIDIATVQTLNKEGTVNDLVGNTARLSWTSATVLALWNSNRSFARSKPSAFLD